MSQILSKSCVLPILIGLGCAGLALAQSAAMKPTPIPTATGPIPVTADSYPFNAANKLQTPIDLAGHGYVEQEFFVSGTGNVYDWAPDGTIVVKASDRPYTTRILVRRPSDPSRFSGTVIVELAHSGRGYDNEMMWGFVGDYALTHGAAYVAITISANTIGGLKMFDMKRYVNLSFPKPVPNVCDAGAGGRGGRGGAAGGPAAAAGGGRGGAAAGGGGGGDDGGALRRPAQFFPPSDDSVKWDVISQVGALLKSKSPSNPMAGFNVQYLFSTDHTASDTATYAKAFTKLATLENGKTVFDGYLIKEGAGPGAVGPCGGRIAQDDPRRQLQNVGAPVMFLVAGNYSARLSSLRREDSDQPGDQFRLYEVPGASHLDKWGVQFIPSLKDQTTVGVARPLTIVQGFDTACDHLEPLSDFPAPYFVHAMLDNLDQWVRKGTSPPRGERINLINAGTPKAAVVNDIYGNATGGIRNPYVDVPSATYVAQMRGTGPCDQMSYIVPFDMGKMDALYGKYQTYQTKFIAGVDKLVAQRWLLPADAENLKAEVRSHNPTKPFDIEKTSLGDLKITPVNHAAVMLEVAGKVIHIDPTSQGDYALLPKADLILVTDIHGDHLDPQAIGWLKKQQTMIVTAPEVAKTVTEAKPLGNGESLEVDLGGTKIKIEAVAAYNMVRGPAPGQFFHPKGRGNGYILTIGGKRIYFSGDTEFIPEMKDLKNIDVAFLCMNNPTETPAEAAEAAKAFRPKVVYAYHYRGQDPQLFADALKNEKGIEVRLRDWY